MEPKIYPQFSNYHSTPRNNTMQRQAYPKTGRLNEQSYRNAAPRDNYGIDENGHQRSGYKNNRNGGHGYPADNKEYRNSARDGINENFRSNNGSDRRHEDNSCYNSASGYQDTKQRYNAQDKYVNENGRLSSHGFVRDENRPAPYGRENNFPKDQHSRGSGRQESFSERQPYNRGPSREDPRRNFDQQVPSRYPVREESRQKFNARENLTPTAKGYTSNLRGQNRQDFNGHPSRGPVRDQDRENFNGSRRSENRQDFDRPPVRGPVRDEHRQNLREHSSNGLVRYQSSHGSNGVPVRGAVTDQNDQDFNFRDPIRDQHRQDFNERPLRGSVRYEHRQTRDIPASNPRAYTGIGSQNASQHYQVNETNFVNAHNGPSPFARGLRRDVTSERFNIRDKPVLDTHNYAPRPDTFSKYKNDNSGRGRGLMRRDTSQATIRSEASQNVTADIPIQNLSLRDKDVSRTHNPDQNTSRPINSYANALNPKRDGSLSDDAIQDAIKGYIPSSRSSLENSPASQEIVTNNFVTPSYRKQVTFRDKTQEESVPSGFGDRHIQKQNSRYEQQDEYPSNTKSHKFANYYPSPPCPPAAIDNFPPKRNFSHSNTKNIPHYTDNVGSRNTKYHKLFTESNEIRYASRVAKAAKTKELPSVLYDPSEGPLPRWLDIHRPSMHSCNEVAWFAVSGPNGYVDVECKIDESKIDFSAPKVEVYAQIDELALNSGFLVGKWLIFVDTEDVDELWFGIAKDVNEGILGCSCKVNAYEGTGKGHVIYVYTDNYQDKNEVMKVRDVLLNRHGIKQVLNYKPEIYSSLGLYGGNKWGLRVCKYTA